MHIEIFQRQATPTPKRPSITNWYWHKNNKGRITCDSEAFPSKAHALRAAKADVVQTIKPYADHKVTGLAPPMFKLSQNEKDGGFILRWS
mgnify:FL=1